MILRGYFGPGGRPRLRAVISFPRLGSVGIVEFLVDTGADASVLSLPDASRILQGQLANLAGDQDFGGVGGGLSCYGEHGSIIFACDDTKSIVAYEQVVFIAKMNNVSDSLLGRDVLDRCAMTYDPENGLLALQVRSADNYLPLTTST